MIILSWAGETGKWGDTAVCCTLQICRVIVVSFVLNFQIDEMTNKMFRVRAKMPI